MLRYPVLNPASAITSALVVADLAGLKALSSPYPNAVITQCRSTAGDEGGGTWVFQTGNQSANVTADPQSGVWAAPNSDSTGASGAWQRQYDGTVNVLWFGARGDDSTDNTTPLQKAIDYAVSTSRLVRIPSGVYRTGTLTITDTYGVYIEGDGQIGEYTDKPGTHLKYMGTGNCIEIYPVVISPNYVYRIHIKGLSITFTQAANAGIKATNLQESTFEDVGILGPTGNEAFEPPVQPYNIACGFDFNGVGLTNVDNCIIVWVDTAINGYTAGGVAVDVLNVTRNNIYRVTTGIKLGVVSYMFISDNWIEGFQNAILLDNASYYIYVYSMVIDSNVFAQSTKGFTEPRAFNVFNSNNSKEINIQAKFTKNFCYFGAGELNPGGGSAKPSYAMSFNFGSISTPPIVNMTISDNWFAGVTTAGIASDTTDPVLIGVGNRTTTRFFYLPGWAILPDTGGNATLLLAKENVQFGGNVGIGINAQYPLHVWRNTNTYSYAYFENASTGGSSVQSIVQKAGTRTVGRAVDYTGQYLFENGVGITTRYSDFNTTYFRDSSSNTLATLNANGLKLESGKLLDVQNTQGTVGAAGGASALPATPTGYWSIKIGGVEYVTPYYAKS